MKQIALLVVAAALAGFPAGGAPAQGPESDAVPLGPGITTPRLIHQIAPQCPRAALEAGVQGTVLIGLVIDESGVPRDVAVWSPLGFGLDESAVKCVSRWRFKPATKDGRPVKVQAQIQINFRLSGKTFDSKTEEQRTRFNSIVTRLSTQKDGKPSDQDVKTMQELAKQKFAAAEYLVGTWQLSGEVLPKDDAAGIVSIQRAADKNYGPALYFIGRSQMIGTSVPKDSEKGLALVRDAAMLGSRDAQFTLGDMYERGAGVAMDLERAKSYFRLCAASGTPECEFQLGKLLLATPQRKERDWLQAIAWVELAEDHKLAMARGVVEPELAKLTAEQAQSVAQLKSQLEHKR